MGLGIGLILVITLVGFLIAHYGDINKSVGLIIIGWIVTIIGLVSSGMIGYFINHTN